MFGNKLGWMLAGTEIIVIGVIIWLLAVAATAVTPPTHEYEPGSIGLLKIELPTAPQSVVPAAMADPCDAADFYRDAIAQYKSNHRAYESASNKWQEADPAKLP